MKCINGDEVKEIPFGHSLVGHRYDDIEISMREVNKALSLRKWPTEDVLRYLIHLRLTLRPQ